MTSSDVVDQFHGVQSNMQLELDKLSSQLGALQRDLFSRTQQDQAAAVAELESFT
jgi:hypothetical protein